MSGAYRTYRGTLGETIRVPEATIAQLSGLHSEPEQFPFAALAVRLGAQRDRLARAASYCSLFSEATTRPEIKRLLAT